MLLLRSKDRSVNYIIPLISHKEHKMIIPWTRSNPERGTGAVDE
jgi:hypothetical protein